jgi:hypothetical protein
MSTDVYGNQIPANPMTPEIYWLAQPDIVRTTMQPAMGTPDAWPAAIKLSMAGYAIDKAIMVYGWNPVLVMAERMAQPDFKGYVQSIAAEPLPGHIKVSLDAKDYPPAHPPVPVPSVTDMVQVTIVYDSAGHVVSRTPVFLWTAGALNYFAPGAGCYDPSGQIRLGINGKQFTQDGVVYTADVRPPEEMMGFARIFMTTPA